MAEIIGGEGFRYGDRGLGRDALFRDPPSINQTWISGGGAAAILRGWSSLSTT